MNHRLHGVSALALIAALAVAGCNRADNDADTTTGAADTTAPGNSAEAPATVPQTTGPGTDTTTADTGDQTGAAGTGQQAGAAMDDAALTAKVKAALLATDGISGTDISVETQQGKVILTGRVPDQAQAQRAAEVASNVEGVQAVDNRIEVAAG